MSIWRVMQAVCLLGSFIGETPQAYDDKIQVKYVDYFNEINEQGQLEMETDTEATPPPCPAPEYSKWDKLFTMLENSQMKENMLLQHSDDVVRVELQALREEVRRLAAQCHAPCSASAESHAHRAELQLQQAAALLHEQQALQDGVLAAVREHAERMASLSGCEQASSLQGAPTMEALLSRQLPAGCDMALFFPMRLSKSYAEVTPQEPMQMDALTLCMWVKPTQAADKAVLFSYGTSDNPLELQLFLSGRSALFTVGGEAYLVEASSAVQEGEWTHLCGTWDSEHGMAALFVDGREITRSPGVAEGLQLTGGGALFLGQEYRCQGRASCFLRGTSDAGLGFTGKITGVNVWNRVLGADEIYEQARPDGRACGTRGNLVAWGVSQITRNGAVELVF